MRKEGTATLLDRIDPNLEFPIEELPIDDIFPDPENYRRPPAKKSLEELVTSVSKVGLLQPIIVEKINGEYKIIGGHRRYFASLAAGKRTVLAKVFPKMTKQLRQEIQIAENTNKKKIPKHDIAHNYWDFYRFLLMYESKGELGEEELESYETYWDLPEDYRKIYSLSQFAERLNKSNSTVRDAFSFQRLHSAIKKCVEKETLSYSAAVELARVGKKSQQWMILRNQLATDDGYAKAQKARAVVNAYLESQRDSSAFGGLFGGEVSSEKEKFSGRADLLLLLNQAIRFMRTFIRISEIDPGICGYHVNGRQVKALISGENKGVENLTRTLCEKSQYFDRICKKRPRDSRSFLVKILEGEIRRSANGQDFLKGQKVKRIPISRIVPDPNQPRKGMRTFLPLEKLAEIPDIVEMSQSLDRIGQMTPVLLRPIRYLDGKLKEYMIVEGHRRTNGARLAGLKYMQAYVLDLSDIEARLVQYESDVHEQDILRERAERIYNLFQMKKKEKEKVARKEGNKGYVHTIAEFARDQVGISVTTVRALLEYHDLDEKTKSLYEDELLSRLDVALYLGQIPGKQRFFYSLYAVLNNSSKSDLEKLYKANTEFEGNNLFKASMSKPEYARWLEEKADGVMEMIKKELLDELSRSISLHGKIITDIERTNGQSLLYNDEPALQKIYKFCKTFQVLRGAVRKKRA
ncbi:MAG: ParB/RepB/Spo0J family partition protein [Nanoarchaeota archaeon]|nr:ParB/RepB/Spo0J family partition protein [Nanoarchaeota archaeon]